MNSSGRLRYLRLAHLVWKLPMYARLVWGLGRDPRTPLALKALLVAAITYLIMPLDLVPDAIPILGQADDLTVLLLVLDLFVANVPAEVRLEHATRARDGTSQLDSDLTKVREVLGDRYDQIRDNLPELLERYGNLRDPATVKAMLADWRHKRSHAKPATALAPSQAEAGPTTTEGAQAD